MKVKLLEVYIVEERGIKGIMTIVLLNGAAVDIV
jgi:hypothetical protein